MWQKMLQVGSGGGSKSDFELHKVWENPSPIGTNITTLEIDVDSYDYYLIKTLYMNTNLIFYIYNDTKGTTGNIFGIYSPSNSFQRTITVTPNGDKKKISIGTSTDARTVIPWVIYGYNEE